MTGERFETREYARVFFLGKGRKLSFVMNRLPVACLTGACLATASLGGAVMGDVSDFNTSLNALSGSEFQLVDTFSILYDLDTAYIDSDLDNAPDFTQDLGLGQYLGDYLDPEHYVLDFALPGSGTDLKPMYMGNELTGAASVDWRLSYATTPGDASSIYSTILSGSATSIGGGLILDITDGLEWPVSGMGPDAGFAHAGFKIVDFDSFTFTYGGGPGNPFTLEANVIPAPGVLALLGLGGLAARRRRN